MKNKKIPRFCGVFAWFFPLFLIAVAGIAVRFISRVGTLLAEVFWDEILVGEIEAGERAVNVPLTVGTTTYRMTCVSMGNPHAVIFVPRLDDIDIHAVGAAAERHELFPERCNIEFAEIVSPEAIRMRVWERGAGETLACGTGACATLVAAVLKGLTARRAVLRLLGGNLDIEWNAADNHVYMSGGAETVFEGEWLLGQ